MCHDLDGTRFAEMHDAGCCAGWLRRDGDLLRLFQGGIDQRLWQMLSGLISLVLLLLFAIGGWCGGAMLGARRRQASPDPDRRQDLA